jgi:hypothetical protein
VSAGRILPALPFLVGRADYLEGTVRDGDFLVDAAIAEPGAELEAKREAALCAETLRNGKVRHGTGNCFCSNREF